MNSIEINREHDAVADATYYSQDTEDFAVTPVTTLDSSREGCVVLSTFSRTGDWITIKMTPDDAHHLANLLHDRADIVSHFDRNIHVGKGGEAYDMV